MAYEVLLELRIFLEGGGTMLTLGGGTGMAGATGLVAELSPRSTGNLFHPGSIVRARSRQAASPILYGYPETFTIFHGNGHLFGAAPQDPPPTVLQYRTPQPPP